MNERKEPRSNLTPRQRLPLAWVKAFIRDHDMPPTVREIGDAFGIKSSSVFHLLKELERKGYIERGGLGARSLIVKGRKRVPCGCEEVPVVGRIAAGYPVEAIEHDAGTLHVNKEILRGRSGFALKVEGDSMVDAGILDGDYVIIRKQETAEDGDVVVALIDDEATLKRFYRDGDGVRLEPANSQMQPIHVQTGEFGIQGKVVGVQRKL
ncbi:MAG TPA: transcriptional repressor LexA [Phycisphaerae bacterium]|nr:transcriptional repressor LexA [Phycisphaerae bacterium]